MINLDLQQNIINSLPYKSPFLFVGDIDELTENHIVGTYTYLSDNSFYEGHFIDRPVTPGVILLETMGQIGVVCFGIYLLNLYNNQKKTVPMLSAAEVEFFKPVFPMEKVKVISKKIYLRHSILKCSVSMFNQQNELVANAKLLCKFISND